MRVLLTQSMIEELFRVNDEVNNNMQYVKDLEQYGKLDKWSNQPGKAGDCEDFARAKELRLRKLNWNPNCMGRATCWNSDGYHCVLLVNTDAGTYVLDVEGDPTPWHDASIKRWSIIPDYILHDLDSLPELEVKG